MQDSSTWFEEYVSYGFRLCCGSLSIFVSHCCSTITIIQSIFTEHWVKGIQTWWSSSPALGSRLKGGTYLAFTLQHPIIRMWRSSTYSVWSMPVSRCGEVEIEEGVIEEEMSEKKLRNRLRGRENIYVWNWCSLISGFWSIPYHRLG